MKVTPVLSRRGSLRLDDAWNSRVRNERPHTRADRNYLELLQEMRLIQTAVTILFAMLLTIPFSVRFVYVDEFQRVVYVATLACSAMASVLLITPVAYHRTLFQRGRKSEIVVSAHRFIRVGLLILTVADRGLAVAGPRHGDRTRSRRCHQSRNRFAHSRAMVRVAGSGIASRTGPRTFLPQRNSTPQPSALHRLRRQGVDLPCAPAPIGS